MPITQLDMFTKRRAKRPPPALEFAVHAMVADVLRVSLSPKWIWWHTPNGGLRTRAEAGMLSRMGVRSGVSDFVLVGPALGRVHALELKRRGRTPTEAQTAFLDAVRAAGGIAEWADNFDDAVDILKAWGAVRIRL